jgi:MbtH protein
MFEDFKDGVRYGVVINHEEQYSIWPADMRMPAGWKSAGKTGSKKECIAYIEEVWTDMRPLKLHAEMAKKARSRL